MLKKHYLFPFACLVLMITSCLTHNPYGMKEAIFKPPSVILDQKPLVYVYREDARPSRSMLFDIANDNAIVGSLKAGSFCSFSVSSGRDHLISVAAGRVLFNAMLIYPATDESIHLLFTFRNKKGYLTPISEEQGRALQGQLAYTVIENKAQKSEIFAKWYDQVRFNPEIMADAKMMRPTDQRMQPDAQHAVITFIRASRVYYNIKAAIWSETQLLGTLGGGHAFQIKVRPGRHVFVGKMAHFAMLDAHVEAGREYFVNVPVTIGWNAPHVRLIPVGGKMKAEDQNRLIAAADTFLELDPDRVTNLMRRHHKEATDQIKDAISQMNAGKLKKRVLNISDGR